MTRTPAEAHRFESWEATQLRAEALAPLREWLAKGCSGPEPLPGLTAALAADARGPKTVELTVWDVEYLDTLTGGRSAIDMIPRDRDAPTRTEIRNRLVDRGILAPSEGSYAIALEYFPTVGIALFAARATTVSGWDGPPGCETTFARTPAHAVCFENSDGTHVRITRIAPAEIASRVAALVDLPPSDDAAGPSDAPVFVASDDLIRAYDLARRRGEAAAIDAFPALREYRRSREAGIRWRWIKDVLRTGGEEVWRANAALTVVPGGVWLAGTEPGLQDTRVQRLSASDALAYLERYIREPGIAHELSAAAAAIRPRPRERWRALPGWQRLAAAAIALVLVLGALHWITGREEFGILAIAVVSLPAAAATILATAYVRGLPSSGKNQRKTIELPRRDP